MSKFSIVLLLNFGNSALSTKKSIFLKMYHVIYENDMDLQSGQSIHLYTPLGAISGQLKSLALRYVCVFYKRLHYNLPSRVCSILSLCHRHDGIIRSKIAYGIHSHGNRVFSENFLRWHIKRHCS